jgi:NitT/TauT family transport system substrate-binding protein
MGALIRRVRQRVASGLVAAGIVGVLMTTACAPATPGPQAASGTGAGTPSGSTGGTASAVGAGTGGASAAGRTTASGSTASPGVSPASSAAGAAAVASTPPSPVRLAEVQPGLTVGLSVARAGAERGFFAEEGLTVEFTSVPQSNARVAALVSGDAQLMLGTMEDVIRSREKDLQLQVVAGLLNAITYNILGQPRLRTLADVRGGIIGVVDLTSGSSSVLFEIMRANGLELNRDYQALIVGGAAERATALRAGVIAATTLPVPDSTRLLEEGYTDLGDAADYIKEYQNSPISVRAEWAAQNRPVLVRYLRALLRSLDWVYAQKDEFVPIAARHLEMEPRYVSAGWDVYAGRRIWPRDARPTLPGIAKIIDILAEQGTFGSSPRPTPAEFVDMSYVEEAQQTLSRSAP